MSPLAVKFAATAAVMTLSMFAGYLCQRKGWIRETAGEGIMTFVAVFGYPAVGFLTIWGTPLRGQDCLLPLLAIAHTVVMTFLSFGLARGILQDKAERGLFAIAGGLGNNGFTMGAFVLYLLYGEAALGLANIYFVLFMPMVVLLMYPLARHCAAGANQVSIPRLLWQSLMDWRSLGLPLSVVAISLSVEGVPRPAWIIHWRLIDVLVYLITPLAFFGIGLRLHLSKVRPLWPVLGWLAGARFLLGTLVALGMAWAVKFTPWPFDELRWNVFVIEGFVPSAVTMVAIANMFDLRPREASVLFVGNTLMYLGLVLPVVFWWFGH